MDKIKQSAEQGKKDVLKYLYTPLRDSLEKVQLINTLSIAQAPLIERCEELEKENKELKDTINKIIVLRDDQSFKGTMLFNERFDRLVNALRKSEKEMTNSKCNGAKVGHISDTQEGKRTQPSTMPMWSKKSPAGMYKEGKVKK